MSQGVGSRAPALQWVNVREDWHRPRGAGGAIARRVRRRARLPHEGSGEVESKRPAGLESFALRRARAVRGVMDRITEVTAERASTDSSSCAARLPAPKTTRSCHSRSLRASYVW